MAGSDLDLSFAQENFDAVLMLWYPGARGGLAAAKILTGAVSPSGKLNVTFYDPDRPLPEFTDYSMKDRTYRYLEGKPQYPFGYGLTYADVEVTAARLEMDGPAALMHVSYCNHSSVSTQEVIQVYVDAADSAYRTPNPRLCGFLRVDAPAHSGMECTVSLDADTFRVVNEKGETVPGGSRYLLYAGTHGPDARSRELTGRDPVKIEVML
jgi:beta-glucosidase